MTLPARKKRQKMGVRVSDVIRCPQHLAFVRKHVCAVEGKIPTLPCDGPIEAAHVRSSGEGGIGLKPGDKFTIPLCSAHHRHQHTVGEAAFERLFRIDMLTIALSLWLLSPPGKRYRKAHENDR